MSSTASRLRSPGEVPQWHPAEGGSDVTKYLLGVDFQPGSRHADGGVEAGGDHGAPRLLRGAAPRAGREWRAGRPEVLAGPDLAKIVTADGSTAPVVTDGPFQEFKEWLAGYQIVDVRVRGARDGDRGPGVRGAGPAASRSQQPIQVRQLMDEAPPTPPRWTATYETAQGGASAERCRPASRTCCASWRRRSSACSPAATATSTRPRTPSRRRCSRPPSTGRATACRTTRAAGCSRPRPGG